MKFLLIFLCFLPYSAFPGTYKIVISKTIHVDSMVLDVSGETIRSQCNEIYIKSSSLNSCELSSILLLNIYSNHRLYTLYSDLLLSSELTEISIVHKTKAKKGQGIFHFLFRSYHMYLIGSGIFRIHKK